VAGSILGAIAVAPAAQGAVLHTQMDTEIFQGSFSQFATNDATQTSETADDFVVPAGQVWRIDAARLRGLEDCGESTMETARLTIYADSGGLPGTAVFAKEGINPSEELESEIRSFPIAGGATLAAGHYWISVQPDLPYPEHCWFWYERAAQIGSPAAFRNPGGGRNPGCTTWGVRATVACEPSPAPETPDQSFELEGLSTPVPAQPKKKKCKKPKRKKKAKAAAKKKAKPKCKKKKKVKKRM
jgi:hypothetical protein